MKNDFDEVELWEQQQNERPKYYSRFCLYRDMPYGTEGRAPERRSLRVLSRYLGMKTSTSLERLSSAYNWKERVEAYDVYMAEKVRFQNEKKIEEMHERHAKLAEDMIALVNKRIPDMNSSLLDPQDIARMADVAVKIERMSRGDSGESLAVSGKAKVEHSGSVGISGSIEVKETPPDFSALSDSELESLEALLMKANGDGEGD